MAAAAAPSDRTTWIERRRPDPFKRVGVPDRLVLTLRREGLHYVGKIVLWDYREIQVKRPTGLPGEHAEVTEMLVDASNPRVMDIVVQMHQRPTAARLVAELIDALKPFVGYLSGRHRRMSPEERKPRTIRLD